MVGYSDPCPCCGNKRRKSILERWDSCPTPRSAPEFPPSAKFARSVSAPIAAVTSTVRTPPPEENSSPASKSFPPPSPPQSLVPSDRPISIGIEACNVIQAPDPDPSPNPIISNGSLPMAAGSPNGAEVEVSVPVVISPAAEKKEVETVKKEGEAVKEGKEEEKKKSLMETRVSGAEEVKISYKCMCGSTQEVVFSYPKK